MMPKPRPAATISSVRGPAPGAVAMPSVNTDDPEMPTAWAKSTPLFHQTINARPNRIRHSHRTNCDTTATGPTNERRRSRAAKSGRRGVSRRADALIVRARVPKSREEVARGTTNAVNTLQTVSTTMAMPATSATRRASSTAPSCQMPGRRRPVLRPVPGQAEASLAAGLPLDTREAGTSTKRERSSSPRPFAWLSSRRFEATPQPRIPWTTKLTARRFGSG